MLHSFGLLSSFKDGHPGFVSDDYLSAIAAETSVAAVELEAAGVWDRRPGGYFIVKDDMVGMLISHNEEMAALAEECAQRRCHLPADRDGEVGGWLICTHCGVPLERPDGGPVALPDGGPIGPDPRA